MSSKNGGSESYFEFVSRRMNTTKRPAIPPYVPKPLVDRPEPGHMGVEESEGTCGSDTVIQRVKRFWTL